MTGEGSSSDSEVRELIAEVERAADEEIAPHASDVDRNARAPLEGVAVLKRLRLLSASLPTELGGMDLKPTALTEIASVLGRRCSATGMVFAMHEAQIECIRFATVGEPHWQDVLREHAEQQLLIASVTSEAGIGGNIRASNAVAEAGDERVAFEKQSPTLSYAAIADSFLITARRSDESVESDQVLVHAPASDVQLEQLGEWDTLGMRGTCSPPYKITVDTPAANLIGTPFGVVASHRMVPWSHLLWAAVWEGIATSAFDNAAKAARKKARKKLAAGEDFGEPRLGDIHAQLQALRAIINQFAEIYERQDLAADDWRAAEKIRALTADAMSMKINASLMSFKVAEQALEIIGMPGYSEIHPLSVTRHIRDLMGARLQVSNNRLRETSGQLLIAGEML